MRRHYWLAGYWKGKRRMGRVSGVRKRTSSTVSPRDAVVVWRECSRDAGRSNITPKETSAVD
ncbi:hypothetical protein E2C01_082053 [Portunus trituberculatus]|uniref:Uncharacterized protein n=1 Tax=Portunus trituberculatus TaxID=210409 RepID=A0A5B7J0J1_PORTR|nr:hypothetical protein [Portunus trituberculatus]